MKFKVILILLILMLFIVNVNAQLMTSVWPKFQHDLNNTGKSLYNSYTNGTLKWVNETTVIDDVDGGITINGNMLYLANGYTLLAYFRNNGTESWRVNLGGLGYYTYSPPTIDSEGNLYLTDDGDDVFSYFPNGTFRWAFYNQGAVGSIALDQTGNVIVGSYTKVYNVTKDGVENWNFSKNYFAYSTPAVDISTGVIYIGGKETFTDNRLYALNSNGTLKWNLQIPGGTANEIRSGIVIDGDNLYFTAEQKVYSVNKNTGLENWNTSILCGYWVICSMPVFNNTMLFVGSDDNKIYAYDKVSGVERWNYTTSGKVRILVISNNDILYFGSTSGITSGKIYAVLTNGSELWNYVITGNWHEPNLFPALDEDGVLYIGAWQRLWAFNSVSTTISGHVTYEDVDGSTYDLPNVRVGISSEKFDFTDASGNYLIEDVADGTYTITVNRSAAFNVKAESVVVAGASLVRDYELSFSKPQLTVPAFTTNYLESTYSHNFKTMNLWENPSFVWGEYYYDAYRNTSNDHNYYEQCVNVRGNVFACNAPKTSSSYTFRMVYSDMYNMNLSQWHPSLTGYRNFTTERLYVQNNTLVGDTFKTISNLPQVQRETIVRGYFWEAVFWLFVVFMIIVFLSFSDKR